MRTSSPCPTPLHALGLVAATFLWSGCAHADLERAPPGGPNSARIVNFPSEPGVRDPASAIAAVKLPGLDRYPAVLYLDGSGCRSVVHLAPYFYVLAQQGYAVIALEKRGVQPGDEGDACSREFIEHNTLAERERAARTVAARLAEVLPKWNRELLIMAASEGATFAPAVARDFREVRGLVLLGGGGWTQARELVTLQDKNLQRAGATEKERLDAESRLRQKMESVMRDPRPDAMWQGNPHSRWASYLEYDPLPDLLALNVPIYMANGVRDIMVPVESARAVVEAFAHAKKGNLTSREYETLDHRWFDPEGRRRFDEVGRDLLDWIRHLALARP